jgi:hypothetical protein
MKTAEGEGREAEPRRIDWSDRDAHFQAADEPALHASERALQGYWYRFVA